MVRVCVVGSLNMDLVVRAPHLPRPGETLLGGPFDTFPGGKGANQALAARRLGAEVVQIGAVGRDEFGAVLRQQIARDGVDLLLAPADAPTGVALITIDPAGENTIVVAPGANAALTPAFVEAHRDAITTADLLLVQLEVRFEAVTAAVHLARAAGTTVVLNAAPAQRLPPELLAELDVLVVNRGEAAAVIDADPELAPDVLARALVDRGPRCAVITLGARGALACDGRALFAEPAPQVEALDAVAAGDAFTGALAVGIAAGTDLPHALPTACAAGALATTRRGAQPSLPTRAELRTFRGLDPPCGTGG